MMKLLIVENPYMMSHLAEIIKQAPQLEGTYVYDYPKAIYSLDQKIISLFQINGQYYLGDTPISAMPLQLQSINLEPYHYIITTAFTYAYQNDAIVPLADEIIFACEPTDWGILKYIKYLEDHNILVTTNLQGIVITDYTNESILQALENPVPFYTITQNTTIATS